MTSTTSSDTKFTPDTTAPSVAGEAWDGRYFAVPWPGNKYQIFIHNTNRAICSDPRNGTLYVYDVDKDVHKQHTWLCVEKNGYFGFVNPDSGRFIGHNNAGKLHAATTQHEAWELLTVRKHPDGGYELLMPHWWHTLKKIGVVKGSNDVVLREHIATIWQFAKVS